MSLRYALQLIGVLAVSVIVTFVLTIEFGNNPERNTGQIVPMDPGGNNSSAASTSSAGGANPNNPGEPVQPSNPVDPLTPSDPSGPQLTCTDHFRECDEAEADEECCCRGMKVLNPNSCQDDCPNPYTSNCRDVEPPHCPPKVLDEQGNPLGAGIGGACYDYKVCNSCLICTMYCTNSPIRCPDGSTAELQLPGYQGL